uniref:Uncharacterized protein n=1 Tax=Caenorhabditis japonica TaxID=281687 RepID=A0A8R1IUX8_CAEJA
TPPKMSEKHANNYANGTAKSGTTRRIAGRRYAQYF